MLHVSNVGDSSTTFRASTIHENFQRVNQEWIHFLKTKNQHSIQYRLNIDRNRFSFRDLPRKNINQPFSWLTDKESEGIILRKKKSLIYLLIKFVKYSYVFELLKTIEPENTRSAVG